MKDKLLGFTFAVALILGTVESDSTAIILLTGVIMIFLLLLIVKYQ